MAVDLRPSALRVAHVARSSPERPRLTLLRSFERAGSDTDDLSRLRRLLQLQHYRCTTTLDAASYQIVQMTAPAVPAAEMNGALRWGVKDALDFPVDDAVIDSFAVPSEGTRAGRTSLVLAVAARRERVASRMDAFHRSGVPLKVIDIAEAAQRNLAALFEQPDRALAFLSFDAGGGLLTVTRNGELYSVRHIDVTTAALAETGAARDHVFERIALELQRSLDNFDRLFSQHALQRVLLAPHEGCAELVTYLASNLVPPVEAADLASVFDAGPGIDFGPPGEQAEWLRPLGLALRSDAAAAAHR